MNTKPFYIRYYTVCHKVERIDAPADMSEDDVRQAILSFDNEKPCLDWVKEARAMMWVHGDILSDEVDWDDTDGIEVHPCGDQA